MTTQQKAVIIGFYKQGAPIEQIMVVVGKPYLDILKVVKNNIPKQFTDHVEEERSKKQQPKRSNRPVQRAKFNFRAAPNKRANKKSLSRSIQTHTGL